MRMIAIGLLEEVLAVATAETGRKGLTAMELLSGLLLEGFVLREMSATHNNVSSMIQDVKVGWMMEVPTLPELLCLVRGIREVWD